MGSADQWRWTDDDGVQRLLNGDELRAAMRDGRLRASTLVWRRGMKSWKPAGELSELRLPGLAIKQARYIALDALRQEGAEKRSLELVPEGVAQ